MTGQIFVQERELSEWHPIISFRRGVSSAQRVVLRQPSLVSILRRYFQDRTYYQCYFCHVWAWDRIVQTKHTKDNVGKSYTTESPDGFQCPECGEAWHDFYVEVEIEVEEENEDE